MAWSYELDGSDNRLVELRRGFATKKEAEAAARGAKRMMQAFDFPSDKKEDLTIVTKDEAAE
jgi:hypothetical protein